jgi:tripartite ATP-independent transporter DctP family solute receptor
MATIARAASYAAAGIAAVALLGGPLQAAEYPSMTIRFGDVGNRNFGYYQGMVAFKEEVEAKTGGKIKVEIITDLKLGTAKDVLDAVQLGTVQMTVNTAAYTQNLVPEHGIFNLPYLFKDRASWVKFAYGPMGEELGNKLEARGLKFLTWCSAGGRGILSKKPLATPEDFKGQKVRAMPDPAILDTLKAINGQPVVMNLPEVYTAMQQGILDAADLSIELILAFKINETAKYYTETLHIMTPGMVVANMAWWKKQNKETQDLITKAIKVNYREANDKFWIALDPASSLDVQRQAAKPLADKGVTIVKADLPALKKATAPIIEQYKAKIGKDYVEKVMKEIGYAQ